MNFEIIPNEHTPEVPYIEGDILEYIEQHRDELLALKEFARTYPTCQGLAANQVAGESGRLEIRAFIIKDLKTKTFSIIVNPNIISYIGIPYERVEGCLTWKSKKISAPRYNEITASWYDMNGEKHTENIRDYPAHIWQHEVDHLNGLNERIEPLSWPHTKQYNEGRNDPCPCGSGKKFKKCCWQN